MRTLHRSAWGLGLLLLNGTAASQPADTILARLDAGTAAGALVAGLRVGVPGEHAREQPALARWWRARDPLPATPQNEALQERLARLTSARRLFADPTDPAGLDARGHLFVRLGQPRQRLVVTLRGGMRDLPADALGSPTRGEFWNYDHVAREAHYVFVPARGGAYREATAEDLLPRSLARSPRRAAALIRVMADVYGQLAHLHADYGDLYGQAASYADDLALGTTRFTRQTPNVVAGRLVTQARREAAEHARRRAREVPALYSDARADAERLPLIVRATRFRREDGAARAVVDWEVPAGVGGPWTTTLVRYGAGSARADSADARGFLPYGTLALGGPDTLRLALQVDGARETGTWRPDALPALPPDGLVLSDLRLLRVRPGRPLDEAVPHPSDVIGPGDAFALEFEVYGLRPASGGLARYTIEIETGPEGRRVREGRATSTQSAHEAAGATARHRLGVGFEPPTPGQTLVLTVRVRASGPGTAPDSVAERSLRLAIAAARLSF